MLAMAVVISSRPPPKGKGVSQPPAAMSSLNPRQSPHPTMLRFSCHFVIVIRGESPACCHHDRSGQYDFFVATGAWQERAGACAGLHIHCTKDASESVKGHFRTVLAASTAIEINCSLLGCFASWLPSHCPKPGPELGC